MLKGLLIPCLFFFLMSNLCHLFLHQQRCLVSFGSNIPLSSIVKPTLPDTPVNLISPSRLAEWATVFQFLGMWPYLLIILLVTYTISNLSTMLLNMIRVLILKTMFNEDNLPNLISHLPETHRLSKSSVGKIQFLYNTNNMSFQTDSTSKLFHHLQHILTDKMSRLEDRNYLNLQENHRGIIRTSMLHISARDQLKAWTGTSTAASTELCFQLSYRFLGVTVMKGPSCFSSPPARWWVVPRLTSCAGDRAEEKEHEWGRKRPSHLCLFWDSQQGRQGIPAARGACGLKTYLLGNRPCQEHFWP